MNRLAGTLIILISLLGAGCNDSATISSDPYKAWDNYLGDAGRTHYSSLTAINRENVTQLQKVWSYEPGDDDGKSYSQCNPLIIGRTLFAASSHFKVFALDAATGVEKWKFDPFEGTDKKDFARGLAAWTDGEQTRIIFTADKYLYAMNAETGELVTSFGDGGRIDLTKGLDRDITGLAYQYHAPATVYKDLILMGSLTAETLPAAPGHIRGFDAVTGEQKWIFHTIPHPGEYGYDSWEDTTAYQFIGGANNWTGMTVDETRGILFVPTGSASYDFYGANRKGANLFANSLIALNANTGERIWHFQAVHHDIWDRDFPAPPTLVTVRKDGKSVDAVAQISKSGHVYVFNRETGESLFPIEEKPYPPSDLPGEAAWPTQPLPTEPPPFSRQTLTEDDLNPYSNHKEELLTRIRGYQYGGQFIPPSTAGTLLYPGLDGGGEWGGAGYDPTTGILYVNGNEMAWIIKMIELDAEDQDPLTMGKNLYQANCMSCHGADLSGSTFHGAVPALTDVKSRLKPQEMATRIRKGKGSMPAFGYLEEDQVTALIDYLLNWTSDQAEVESNGTKNLEALQYRMEGYQRFVDRDGYPAVKPPWGHLNAIDLNNGTIKWKVPLGEFEELTARGIPKTGTENYGGPVVTAGGLIFIAGTKDPFIRAFDKETGAELWKGRLPRPGLATPATYEVDGRQYVVVAASGGKDTPEKGDEYVAFALPGVE